MSPYLRSRLRSLEEAQRARERARLRLGRMSASIERLEEPPVDSAARDAGQSAG